MAVRWPAKRGQTGGGGGGGGDLGDLNDVTITSATTGDLLRWNGSAWVDYADSAYAAASHSHAASDVTSGTFADARIAESNVTQHEAALSITESQISDLGTYLTAVTPGLTQVFEGTLSSATEDTNAAAGHDFAWDDATEHADITHTDGGAVIQIDVAGEYWIYVAVDVTAATAANRAIWRLNLRHRDSGDSLKFLYRIGTSYIRSGTASYDDGGCSGFIPLVVAAGDDITIQSVQVFSEDPTDDNPADQSTSYLRIFRKTYT